MGEFWSSSQHCPITRARPPDGRIETPKTHTAILIEEDDRVGVWDVKAATVLQEAHEKLVDVCKQPCLGQLVHEEDPRRRAQIELPFAQMLEERMAEDHERGRRVRLTQGQARASSELIVLLPAAQDDASAFVEQRQRVLFARAPTGELLTRRRDPAEERLVLPGMQGALAPGKHPEHQSIEQIVVALLQTRHLARARDPRVVEASYLHRQPLCAPGLGAQLDELQRHHVRGVLPSSLVHPLGKALGVWKVALTSEFHQFRTERLERRPYGEPIEIPRLPGARHEGRHSTVASTAEARDPGRICDSAPSDSPYSPRLGCSLWRAPALRRMATGAAAAPAREVQGRPAVAKAQVVAATASVATATISLPPSVVTAACSRPIAPGIRTSRGCPCIRCRIRTSTRSAGTIRCIRTSARSGKEPQSAFRTSS